MRLNGHIQRGNRLVADDELGLHGQGAGDADALALSAGEFVRIAGGVLAVQPDEGEQLEDAVVALLFAGIHMMHVQRLAHDVGNRHARVQRGVGILKDHRGLRAELPNVVFGLDELAVIVDFAGGGLVEMQNRAADRGLAAAGLADQAERLAPVYGEGHVVNGL